eukprot:Rmarinus@m.9521
MGLSASKDTKQNSLFQGRVLACDEVDLPVGAFRRITGEGFDILVCHTKRGFFAVSGKCSHYGAPLDKGVMKGDRVVCPWHGACFNVETGDMEDSPGVHPLKSYQISREDGKVYVNLPGVFSEDRRRQVKSSEKLLIVGGGAAGVAAAKVLVEKNYEGLILMICKENMLPYDRTRLTKDLKKAMDLEFVRLLDETWFDRHRIDLRLGVTVLDFDAVAKRATLFNFSTHKAETVVFDKALIATGMTPRQPFGFGSGTLQNIFSCRDFDDVKRICAAATAGRPGKHVVCVGSSFLGMEAAAYFAQLLSGETIESVTVVMRGSVPLQVIGEVAGLRLMKLHEQHGVTFVKNAQVQEFVGKDGAVVGIRLDTGRYLDADIVVTGLGSVMNSSFLRGLDVNSDGAILADAGLQTSCLGVFAAGDAVSYPYHITGKHITVGHWATAQQQGRIAACNLMNERRKFETTPFFWTQQYGKSYRYAGHAPARGVKIVTEGDVDNLSFLSLSIIDNKVHALGSIGRDPQVAAFYELLNLGKLFSLEEVQAVNYDFCELLRKA